MAEDGLALHRIDFSAHDCWIGYEDPLVFLRFPDWLWNAAGSNRGTPNRRRHHEFVSAFRRAGLAVAIPSCDRLDEHETDLTRLHPRFTSMPRDSLIVQAAVYRLTPARDTAGGEADAPRAG